MPEEKIEKEIEIPIEEQKPIEVQEIEIQKIPEGERQFLSQIDDDLGFLRVVSTIPTDPPKTNFQRIKVYVSGSTRRLYIWDGTTWRYVTLT